MRRLIVLASIMSCLVSVKAQTAKTLFNFEESALETIYWSESNNAISLDKEHVREGAKALKWELKDGAKLVLNYVSDEQSINLSYDRVMYIPIYCSKPSNDKLIIKLYSGDYKVAEAIHDLNYQGWLPFQRYIRTDFGKEVKRSFNRIEISYEPQNTSNSQTVWIDGMCSAANNYGTTSGQAFYECVLGPQAKTDYLAGVFTERENLNMYFMEAYMHQKGAEDMLPISEMNKAEVDGVLSKYTKINVKQYSVKFTEAKAFIDARKITETADGGVNASSKWLVYTPAQAAMCGDYIASLAYEAIDNNNSTANDYLIKLTRYMLDYGMAPGGGEVGMQPSNYTASREFAKGFLYAMPIYEEYDAQHPNAGLKKRVVDLLKWCYNYGYIYGKPCPELLTLDQVHVKLWAYFNLASLCSTAEQRASELRLITRFMERMAEPQSGKVGVIRPDGIGFHHNAMHNSYMYGFQSWIGHAANLKGTSFRVGLSAYENVRLFVNTLYKQCVTAGTSAFYSNAQCGRGAFNLTPGVNQAGLEMLALVGGDILGKAYDSEVASLCKLFYPASKFADNPMSLDGFYQMNYGNMGVYRNGNYVVTMRGLSSNFWGTEIYNNANRFGRYQSYGTTEILYSNPQGYAASGYPTDKGWDWNVVPGTTTVHSSWKELNAGGHDAISRLGRADEYQTNSFAGSLSAGNCGIFALDFKENAINLWGGPAYRYTPSQLEFKKTVFAVDGLLICLGSNIKFDTNVGLRTATNLFQNIKSQSVGSLYINDENPINDMLNQDLPSNNNWLVTPAGTGYYVPSNNSTLHVVQGEQETPNTDINFNTSPTAFPMITTQVAKAWITHGSTMDGDKYEFVVAPQTTPTKMKVLASELSKKMTYEVLQQNEFAHIVNVYNTNTTAYAIFNAQTDFRSLKTLVKEVDNPCMIITKEKNGTADLTICSPDVLYNCIVTVDLKGKWTVDKLSANIANIDNSDPETTTISFLMKDGLSANVLLNSGKTSTAIVDACINEVNVVVSKDGAVTTVLFADSQDKVSFKIFNQTGLQLFSQENVAVNGNSLQINTSSYNSGLYCIKLINSEGKVYNKKFVIK